MSSQRVKTISRTLYVSAFSQATSTLTLTFSTNHFLKVTDTFTLFADDNSAQSIMTVASVTNATTITVTVNPSYVYQNLLNAYVEVPYYSAGQTGVMPMFSFPLASQTGVVQFIANGAGGASFTLTGSLKKDSAPINLASFSIPTSNGATDYITISVPWAYLGLNITSIGANTTIIVLRAA